MCPKVHRVTTGNCLRQLLGHALRLMLGHSMVGVCAVSFVVRPGKCYFRLGLNAVLALVLYVAGCIFLARLR